MPIVAVFHVFLWIFVSSNNVSNYILNNLQIVHPFEVDKKAKKKEKRSLRKHRRNRYKKKQKEGQKLKSPPLQNL
jgi:hypothetical protein